MRPLLRLLALSVASLVFVHPSTGVSANTGGAQGGWDAVLYAAPAEVQGLERSASMPESATVRPKASEMTVRYHGVPAEGQTAIDAGVTIWEQQFISSVETIVDITWVDLSPGLLGRMRYGGNVKDDSDDSQLPVADVVYPAALANAIRGSRVNSEPDITIELNSTVPWYFGVDGRTAAGKFDLTTVVMHEIGQGLGFSSRLEVADGKVQLRGLPTIFDTFLVDWRGVKLLTMLGKDDASLKAAVLGGGAFFSGDTARTSAGKSPRMYTPATWAQGTSLSHLDDAEYGPPSVNRLLAPFTYSGWPQHDPGPIVLAIMQDIGWKIAGIGQPARVGITRLPSAAKGGGKTQMDVSVEIQDPFGALVTSDNTTVVTFNGYGVKSLTPGDCIAESSFSKVVSNGRATFRKCFLGGYGFGWFEATAPGLAPGASNAIMFAATIATAPMVGRGP